MGFMVLLWRQRISVIKHRNIMILDIESISFLGGGIEESKIMPRGMVDEVPGTLLVFFQISPTL